MIRPRRLLVLVVALTICAGVALVETHFVSARSPQLRALRARHAALERELADAIRRQQLATRELQHAEQQLAQLAPLEPASSGTSAPPTNSAAVAWLARMKQLRAWFTQNLAHRIPEMQLLDDADWLRVARDASFETDAQRRQAAAALRTAAKNKFAQQLATASRQYSLADLSKIPSHPRDLAAFLQSPVDPAILERYRISSPGRESVRSARWRVDEVAPVDEDYDTHFHIDGNGSHGTSGHGPAAWIENFQPRLLAAHRAYAAAHSGAKPVSLAQVFPYFQPPLPSATVEKLLKTERERGP